MKQIFLTGGEAKLRRTACAFAEFAYTAQQRFANNRAALSALNDQPPRRAIAAPCQVVVLVAPFFRLDLATSAGCRGISN